MTFETLDQTDFGQFLITILDDNLEDNFGNFDNFETCDI